MKTVCIMCPIGCNLDINEVDGEVIVKGNKCPRGQAYGKNELVNPLRIVTSIIKLENGTASVKTTKPIPKKLIFKCQQEIENLKLKDVKVKDIVIKNVLNLDCDIVVTGVFKL